MRLLLLLLLLWTLPGIVGGIACPASSHAPAHAGAAEFIERIELECDDAARAAGCYVASAMGFDSVPADLGVQYTLAQFPAPARCTQVESALTIHGGPSGFRGHFPTFESAVLGFAAASELRTLRKAAEKVRRSVCVGRAG